MLNFDRDIVIESMTDDNAHESFELASRIFVESSVLHVAVDISLEDYREYIFASFESVRQQGLSLAATDRSTGKVVGVLVACDYLVRGSSPALVPEPMKPVNALLQQLEALYLKDRLLKNGESMLVDMAVVDPVLRGCGVYTRLRQAIHDVGRKAGFKNVVGELSSAATQHLCVNRFGHTILGEVKFKQFKYAEQYPFASIQKPAAIVVVEGSLY